MMRKASIALHRLLVEKMDVNNIVTEECGGSKEHSRENNMQLREYHNFCRSNVGRNMHIIDTDKEDLEENKECVIGYWRKRK